jgi:sulfatase maturation enzyme AslB (radical SAM superfamily)
MPNKDVFCNSPWYELHIFWDGSFGYCCQQTPHRPYVEHLASFYNIKTMAISDWHTSKPMNASRLAMFSDDKMSNCDKCWYQERFSSTSRRRKANSKSVLFKQAFDVSFEQSPNYDTFESSFDNGGETTQMPLDFHIDLGNYCNLACKFCCPDASSKIASQYKKWDVLGNESIVSDWTKNDDVWDSFIAQIMHMDLQNIHLMGGETLITPRFEDLVDALIENERYEVCISFVTNGTSFNKPLMDKLKNFKRVGIEVSIETLTEHNEYIRQGTKNSVVIGNINRYIDLAKDSTIDITIRPALSLLSIGYYHTLLEFCLDKRVLLKSNNVIGEVGWKSSKCLDVRLLPTDVKTSYKKHYVELLNTIDAELLIEDFNESDSNNYKNVIRDECHKCIALLDSEVDHDLYPDLVELLEKWDKVYELNAIELYPELSELLLEHNYNVN